MVCAHIDSIMCACMQLTKLGRRKEEKRRGGGKTERSGMEWKGGREKRKKERVGGREKRGKGGK